MKIESHDTTVEKLLNGSYFMIPRFQRPYSWEEENISDFWSDVTDKSNINYFIGSMVVYHAKGNTLGIVDGQQRLTTIMIFMCVIRDAFREIGSVDLAEGLHTYIEKKNRDNKFNYVLQTETSFPFLQENILKDGKAEIQTDAGLEEKAIQKASEIFKKKINNKIMQINDDETISKSKKTDEKIAWLTDIRNAVLELNLILIELDNEDDAYLIFETLNTRGKDLALADLVKNLFTRHLKGKGDVDYAKIKWNSVLETIHGSDVDLSPDTFIVHSWQSRYESVTKAKAYPKLKDTITKLNAKNHLEDFAKEATYYRSIFEPSYNWNKDEQKKLKSLETLQLFKLSQQTPAVLALVRAYQTKKIKFGKLVSALRAIENFHFFFTAITSSRSSGGISGMYSSFGRKLFEATDTNVASDEIKFLIKKLRERVPSESEFYATFEQVIYTSKMTTQRSLVKYILMEIAKKEKLAYPCGMDDLTIEHIIPQTKISDKYPNDLIGQIGNLMLVDEETNGLLGSKSFSQKKTILIKRGYQLPIEWKNVDKLTPQLITSNTRKIAESAYNTVWKI